MVSAIIMFLLFVLIIFISVGINRLIKEKVNEIHIRVGYLLILFSAYIFWYIDNSSLSLLKTDLFNIFLLYLIPIYLLTLSVQVLNRKDKKTEQ